MQIIDSITTVSVGVRNVYVIELAYVQDVVNNAPELSVL
jgi:hypothetical protein